MIRVNNIDKFYSPKVVSPEAAADITSRLKSKGKVVGLCHGGFDLMHPGHILHFQSAKKMCDHLVVSLTSDRYVAKIKGEKRPVFTDRLRAYAVASLDAVDNATVIDEETGVEILRMLKPSLYFKDDEFADTINPAVPEKLNRRLYAEVQLIRSLGGDIMFTHEEKLSTTDIISHIKSWL